VLWTPPKTHKTKISQSASECHQIQRLQTFFYQVKSIPLWILNTSINPITPNKKGKKNRIAIGKMNPQVTKMCTPFVSKICEEKTL
jgi:hypothetical protein